MSYSVRPNSLATLSLLASVLVAPAVASADIIPPSISACRSAEEGDECEMVMGPSEGGTCVMARCRGKDYSNGAPPEYYYYRCLKCLSPEKKKQFQERIEAGEVKSPDELPTRDEANPTPTPDIEIVRGDGPDVPTDPPDIADDEESEADAGSDEDADSEENDEDATTDDDSNADKNDDTSSSSQTSPDNDSGSNMLVTAGSIGLGLFFVVVGFWRRRTAEDT